MPPLDRRGFLACFLGSLLALSASRSGFADGGGGNSGPGGGGNSGPGGGDGGNSGPGGGDGGNSGPGGGDGDDHGDDDHDDDDRAEASTAVHEGRAAPLRELLAVIRRQYPGDVVDVRLRRTGKALTYRVKILDRRGRLVSVSIDAASKRILRAQGL
jgi:hypothetical protein